MSRFDTSVLRGEDLVEITVSYTARPGIPPSPWSDSPDPGSPPEFDIEGAEILTPAGWADYLLTADERVAIEADIAECHDFATDGPDPDDARDRQRDDALHEAHFAPIEEGWL